MGRTTFSGPVTATRGFEMAPAVLADADATLTESANGNRINLVPNGTQDNTYTLPAPTAGAMYTFVYAGGAADATDFLITSGADANFFIGGVTFDNTGDGAASVVYSDGNSNSTLQVNVPAAAEICVLGLDATNWQVFGRVTGATAPAFADQA